MLGARLAALDIPSDGSARLMSVKTSVDPNDDCMTWVLVFKEVKKGVATENRATEALPSAESAPLVEATPTTATLLPPPCAKSVTFAPVQTCMPSCATASTQRGDTVPTVLMDRIFPLKCQVKTYAWGKLGQASLVGRLAEAGLDEAVLTAGTPYAELWMGTHPSGPSMVMLTSPWRTVTPLSEWIRLNPSLLGPARSKTRDARLERRQSMVRMSAHSLPFLFKVLSVRTALSIQAHPDKALAAQLHVRTPDMYKDDNHKPEMAVAITPFEALCSFQPAFSVVANCRATPELVALVGADAVAALDDAANLRALTANPACASSSSCLTPSHVASGACSPSSPTSPGVAGLAASSVASASAASANTASGDGAIDSAAKFRDALQTLFRRLMLAPVEQVKLHLEALMNRVASTNEMLRTPVDVLAMRLHEQYPGDVGVFCVYLLNYTQLQPGQALFLGANEPHAYISGDCAEIMATSDNVVRAGLTPKWKDVDTLCEMLTYSDGTPPLVTPTQPPGEPHVWRYAPPSGSDVDEFVLDRVELDEAGDTATLGACSGLSILLIVSGAADVEQLDEATDGAVGLRNQLSAGAVHLVCPHTVLRLQAHQPKTLLFLAAAGQ